MVGQAAGMHFIYESSHTMMIMWGWGAVILGLLDLSPPSQEFTWVKERISEYSFVGCLRLALCDPYISLRGFELG